MLRSHLESKGSRVQDELPIAGGCLPADVVEITNNEINGFEIKSDVDTLRRLPNQVKVYSLVFDRCSIVTTKKYLRKVREMVPEWWGIIIATDGEPLDIIHEAEPSPESRASRRQYQGWMLWGGEYEELCVKYGCLKGRSQSAQARRQRLVAAIGEERFMAEFRDKLANRVKGSWVEKYGKGRKGIGK